MEFPANGDTVLNIKRIGFVSSRISGTDGVSLEISKWTEIVEKAGYETFFICGKSDRPVERTFKIPEAELEHPEIREIYDWAFRKSLRTPKQSRQVQRLTACIKEQLYQAIARFKLDAIIAENALTIPMNIPLGLALVEFLLETGIPCLAHHHDFTWERERFVMNCVGDYLHTAFPPALRQFEHVVINSMAAESFSRRTGIPCRVIPNVMNFERPPEPMDDYGSDFRQTIGLKENDLIILQPTRVIQRKGIEHTIELASRLRDLSCRVVVTHDVRDEGDRYLKRVKDYANLLGVSVTFADRWIGPERTTNNDGSKCYSVWDAYACADLVAYPSTFEGFGNAFLEAVYQRRPIFCNRYAIFRRDIQPYGFRTISMDGFLTDEVIADVRKVLQEPGYRRGMVEHNYEVAHRYFSYERVRNELASVLNTPRPQLHHTSG